MEDNKIIGTERELGWDDEISKERGEFIVLPEGDYDFTIESFERGRFNGSEKMPACNRAILNIRINSPEGAVYINHSLLLHTRTEGLLSSFFESIGQKEKGKAVRMNWSAVTGATGRCKVEVHQWKDKEGNERQSNRINKFYPKESKKYAAGDF